mgnify:CR=1 FL=1
MTSLNIRELISKRGCFDKKENLRIYDKFFKKTPRTFRMPLQKYQLYEKKVLDIGCSYGQYLIRFGPESVGIDIQEKMINFGRGLGLQIIKSDVDKDIAVSNNSFDAIWCSNLLEHVISPHKFLKICHDKLNSQGLLFIKVPLIPSLFVDFIYSKIFGDVGYRQSEHIYAYTKKSIEFIVNRAGFRVIEGNIFLFSNKLLDRLLNPPLSRLNLTITIVAKKIDNFSLSEKRPV